LAQPQTLEESLRSVRSGMEAACRRSGRDPSHVLLVAVTKTVPVEVIRRARALGVEHFAENYANELSAKAAQVTATWHFVGKLQSGTAPRVADHANFVHSAQPGRALQRVASRAGSRGSEIKCLAQIDFSGRRQGVHPDRVEQFLQTMVNLEAVRLVGLMTMPPWADRAEDMRPYYARLRELRDGLRTRWPEIVELSMGMSGDYHVAIEEGATMVRIGTALFGARPDGGRPGGTLEPTAP
jgi:pyridoxal phosphate enzyme (YggS family)